MGKAGAERDYILLALMWRSLRTSLGRKKKIGLDSLG